MKAKDTVMTQHQVDCEYEAWADYSGDNAKQGAMDVAKRQAEISFKAGMENKVSVPSNYSRKELKRSWEDGHKSGIKEVVDWMKENPVRPMFLTHENAQDYKAKWESKLKEWGL